MSQTYIPKALRRRVAAQAFYRCGYCLTKEKVSGLPMDIDHIIPEALGGLTEEDNLWLACAMCNALKGNRVSAFDPVSGQVVPFFNPRHQVWQTHFSWTAAGNEIVGQTPVGRVTVLALQLNRELLVNARNFWIVAGAHPPKDEA